jgi:hypothetical protein
MPQAGLPVPLCRAKTHPLGGAQSPAPVYLIPGGAQSSAPVNSCGPRGRGPSHSTIREGHSPLCHRQDCLCHCAERERTLGEGHSPLCPFSSAPGGARSSVPTNFCGPRGRGPSHSRSFPFHHSGGAQSSVPQAGLPVPRGRARTHPLGGAQSSVPVYLIPGGAQSPAPVNSCGPRGRGPSQRSIQ